MGLEERGEETEGRYLGWGGGGVAEADDGRQDSKEKIGVCITANIARGEISGLRLGKEEIRVRGRVCVIAVSVVVVMSRSGRCRDLKWERVSGVEYALSLVGLCNAPWFPEG